MAAVALSGVAKAILAKVGGKAAGALSKVVKNPVARGAAGTAATVGATVAVAKSGQQPPPGMPSQLPQSGALPGQGTAMTTGSGSVLGPMPITAPPTFVSVPKAAKGYVIVEAPNGAKVQVLKEVAYALGLKKRPRKSVAISSRDVRGAQKVQTFIQRFSVARKPKSPLRKGRRR